MHLVSAQEQLIEIMEDGNVSPEFQKKRLDSCWMGLKNKNCVLIIASDALLFVFEVSCV